MRRPCSAVAVRKIDPFEMAALGIDADLVERLAPLHEASRRPYGGPGAAPAVPFNPTTAKEAVDAE